MAHEPGGDVWVPVVSTAAERAEAAVFTAERYEAESPAQRARARREHGAVFSLLQYLRHPDFGTTMLTQEQLDAGLARLAELGFEGLRYADIWHGLDRFSADDVAQAAKKGRTVVEGTLKPLHAHAALWVPGGDLSVRQVAKMFDIPASRVKLGRDFVTREGGEAYRGPSAAADTFFDLAEYLVHEKNGVKLKGKYPYADAAVRCNFDFRAELTENRAGAKSRRAGGGARRGNRRLNALMVAVLSDGMTLREVRRSDPVLYGAHLADFKKWRGDYLVHQEPPQDRTNYYLGGAPDFERLGRTGKSVLAKLLARSLYPKLDADEAYFVATDKRAPLQNYAGQPVIIFDDFTPLDLLDSLGGRNGFLRAFDSHPARYDANIKHGVTSLVNRVTIVTRAMPYAAYFDALSGEFTGRDGTHHAAEAPEQYWGRFAVVGEVTPDMVRWLVNDTYIQDTPEYRAFRSIAGMRIGVRGLVEALGRIGDPEQRAAAELAVGEKVLAPVLLQHEALRAPGGESAQDVLAELLPAIEDAVVVGEVEPITDGLGHGQRLSQDHDRALRALQRAEERLIELEREFRYLLPAHSGVSGVIAMVRGPDSWTWRDRLGKRDHGRIKEAVRVWDLCRTAAHEVGGQLASLTATPQPQIITTN